MDAVPNKEPEKAEPVIEKKILNDDKEESKGEPEITGASIFFL